MAPVSATDNERKSDVTMKAHAYLRGHRKLLDFRVQAAASAASHPSRCKHHVPTSLLTLANVSSA
jgi:hypothetical protein